MTGGWERDEGRHFNGFNTRLVVDYLRRCHPPGTLEAVLRRAGETRPVSVLTDDTSWSSYGQFRALLEATADEVGWSALAEIGPRAEYMTGEAAASAAPLQALGTPDVLLREAAASGTGMGMSAITRALEAGEAGPNEFLMQHAFVEGFEPFRAWCAYFTGLAAIIPTLFGMPLGEVVEEACCCDGAPACQVRLRWQPVTGADEGQQAPTAQVEVLRARLASLEATAADLVASDDVDSTLGRLASAAARILRVPSHVLVLDDASLANPLVVGAADEEEALAVVRCASATSETDVLVAEVSSARQAYGRLAVLERGRRFRPHERETLTAYARLAAAALDSASALADARRQAGTATALLHLSSALDQVVTSEDLAAVLARTVPAVIDCDRAAVLLPDADGATARVAAVHGYDDETAAALLGAAVPLGDDGTPAEAMEILRVDSLDEDDPVAALMRASASVAAAVVPMLTDGVAVGWVVAAVGDRPERLERTVDLEERLRGIAAHGAAALRNGRLVDAIRHQALHDALTGLPNRVLILDRLGQLLKRRSSAVHPVAVLFVDLDGFKDVNDTLGHETGDRLLRAVGDRLAGSVRDGDSVGRLGGDEFVVIVGGEEHGPAPEAVAERILDLLAVPFALEDGRVLTVTASIGIAAGTTMDPGDLLRHADVALYEAKAAGRGRAVTFRPEMGQAVLERAALERDLQRAMAERQFFLLYQPIVDLATEEVCGVEALLRWNHPERGIVPPGDFVPLLEESGLIVPVGAWVVRQACAQAQRWQGRGLSMSVNVSPRQLEGAGLLDDVRAALEETGLEPRSLVLEITEGAVMADPASAAARLHELRRLGVRIAIDDFGTGYSSLAAVRDFPVDILKIDRSFVAALAGSPQSRSLIRLFVQLGRTLNLATVAEGVEEAVQLTELQGERCDHAQGFFFAHPLLAEDLDRMLAGSVGGGFHDQR